MADALSVAQSVSSSSPLSSASVVKEGWLFKRGNFIFYLITDLLNWLTNLQAIKYCIIWKCEEY